MKGSRITTLKNRDKILRSKRAKVHRRIQVLERQRDNLDKLIANTGYLLAEERKKKVKKPRLQPWVPKQVVKQFSEQFWASTPYMIGRLLPDTALEAIQKKKTGVYTIADPVAVVRIECGKIKAIV